MQPTNGLIYVVALAVILASGATSEAAAQTSAADLRDGNARVAQATPTEQGRVPQPSQPGMMGQGQRGMMGQGMGEGMQPGTMGSMPMMGHGGGMRGHTMKIMFAIADTDGDGALSFQEVTTVHKRIFDAMDVNKDGKLTPEEVQAFMRE